MRPELELLGGGALRVERVEGERVVLESARAFPPGSTLEFRAAAADTQASEEAAAQAVVFKVKVRGCRRVENSDHFRIEGRFVSLSRAARELLEPR
jgi:hypothetical protein